MNEANKMKMETNPTNSAFIPANNIELIQSHDALWNTPAMITNGLLQNSRDGKASTFQHPHIMVRKT